jgi:hypothetical protein
MLDAPAISPSPRGQPSNPGETAPDATAAPTSNRQTESYLLDRDEVVTAPGRNNGVGTGSTPLAEPRRPDGTFGPRNAGRPKDSRNRSTQAALALLEAAAEALTRKAVELALAGDTTALRLCLERLCPPRKDTPIVLELPPLTSAGDAADAVQAVVMAVSQGEITPLEGASVVALIDAYRRMLELTEIEARLAELEDMVRGPA